MGAAAAAEEAEVMNGYPPACLVDREGNFNPEIEQHLNLAGETCPVASVSIMGVQSTAAEVMNGYHPTSWLVDGDGNFNPEIEQHLNLAGETCPVASVSIMGVQSTGKSTLLNKTFSTNFQEMDDSQGMSQTTRGILIEKCTLSPNGGPKILVIDTEGSDGSERESDDTFEKKSTLFALAMSNTVIFNMKCDNVNLRNGASRPILETVVQVMLRKFSTPRRVNLLFVLRDKNRCPLDALRSQVIRGLHEIWQAITRTPDNLNAPMEDYFNIEVMAMPHYRLERKEFDMEVGTLRERVMTLVQHGQLLSPASRFVPLAQTNWNDIMEDKILNLQLNKITVDGVICHAIANNKSKNFLADKSWLQIKRDVDSGTIVEGFGNDVSAIIGNYLSQYDEDTQDTDERKRDQNRNELSERMLEDVERIYLALVENMRKSTLEAFQKDLVQLIRGGSKLVPLSREKLIAKFPHLLQDANIQQANWNVDVDAQLEKLKSEFDSYEEGARTIVAILKQEKIKNGLWGAGLAVLGFTAGVGIVFGETLVRGLTAATGVGTRSNIRSFTAANGVGTRSNIRSFTAVTVPAATSLSTIIAGAFNSMQTPTRTCSELDEARLRNPAVGDLWKLL